MRLDNLCFLGAAAVTIAASASAPSVIAVGLLGYAILGVRNVDAAIPLRAFVFNGHDCRIAQGHKHAGNQLLKFNGEGKENAKGWLGNRKPYNSIAFDFNGYGKEYAVVVCDDNRQSGKCMKSTKTCTNFNNIKSVYVTTDMQDMTGVIRK